VTDKKTAADPADPLYGEGFDDAAQTTPLFDDADPVYAAGWRAYWACREIVASMEVTFDVR
jgi:hypothetical protein